MDEESFLRAIADSPHDEQPLRAFAAWLTERDDQRGGYLQLEIERLHAEAKVRQLNNDLWTYENVKGMDPAWLDKVKPLYIRSPTIGRFYAAHGPSLEPYVKLGDLCTPSTIVCLIEVMEVFNEIPAEMSGVISEVLVSSGDAVEFGQRLFRVDRRPPAWDCW